MGEFKFWQAIRELPGVASVSNGVPETQAGVAILYMGHQIHSHSTRVEYGGEGARRVSERIIAKVGGFVEGLVGKEVDFPDESGGFRFGVLGVGLSDDLAEVYLWVEPARVVRGRQFGAVGRARHIPPGSDSKSVALVFRVEDGIHVQRDPL